MCHKPRAKCADCDRRVFVPVDDRVVEEHLLGNHVMGVYPLLPSETCFFLAADFDGQGWQEDVSAFLGACRSLGVPVAIERSRSGNGAHAWLFFATEVPAAVARRLGSLLLTEAMDRRTGIGFRSYDRLLPNQDTMPKGGFGNLIALPLQKEPRSRGCTVFLDDSMDPIADQWGYLATVRRLEAAAVEGLVADAARRGRILAVRSAPDFDDAIAPWVRTPSGRPPSTGIEPPPEVRATLCQELFLDTRGLSPAALVRLRRIAAFQNPQFLELERLRLSTARIPRIISCSREHPEHLALPRGCTDEVADFVAANDSRLVIDDLREPGHAIQFSFTGTLTIVMVPPTSSDTPSRQDLESRLGFTGIARCAGCDANGPWGLSGASVEMVVALARNLMSGGKGNRFVLARLRMFDGTLVRNGADGVRHLQDRILRDPGSAFLWDRLGNQYDSAEHASEAICAWRRAIELDPSFAPSLFSLGRLLMDDGDRVGAVDAWHRFLRCVRGFERLDRETKRKFTRTVLEGLLEAHEGSGGSLPWLPESQSAPAAPVEGSEAVLQLRSYDLSRPDDWDRLVDDFVRPWGESP